jgi:DNA repair protein RecN (Recombination protein N)
MSRILLALLAVSSEQGGDQEGNLLVFDEIDAGIGGVTAKAVGARLQTLSAGRQVLCITHLPQVAASAQRHFRLEKLIGKDEVSTVVERIEGVELEAEMVRMLGGVPGDDAALAHARELLAGP